VLGAKIFSVSFSLLPGHDCVLTISQIRTLPGNVSELKNKPVKLLLSQCQYENQDHDLLTEAVKSYVSCNFCFLEMLSIFKELSTGSHSVLLDYKIWKKL